MKRIHRAEAIKRHCMECMGYDGFRGGSAGSGPDEAKRLVKECTDPNCQLYQFRNGKDARPPSEAQKQAREKAVSAMRQSVQFSLTEQGRNLR